MFYIFFSDIGQNQVKAVFRGMLGGITGKELSSFREDIYENDEVSLDLYRALHSSAAT